MKLHEYQTRASRFIQQNTNSILAVGMGLGKTAATIDAINSLSPSTLLIVAPKRVAESVWMQEAIKWGYPIASLMVVVSGTKAKRDKMMADTTHPYKIISRDNLGDAAAMQFDMLVLDELTSFKTAASKRSIACYSINAKRKVGLTGTFIANGSIDIFGQAAAVGIFDGTKKTNFFRWRSMYFEDKLAGSGLPFPKWGFYKGLTVADVIAPIEKHIFTLSSDDYLEIPEVKHITHDVELSPLERENYMSMDTMLGCDLGSVDDDNAKFMKLQTLCSGFMYLKEEDDIRMAVRSEHSTKLTAVADFCERAVGESEQVLLFYSFKEEAKWLAEMMTKRGIKFCSVTGDKNFLKKWEDGTIDVLFAHPASAGHGLNLQKGGRILVWSNITDNYEYFAQANARLARQGQRQAVEIHYFTATDTIEQRKLKNILRKESEDKHFIDITKQ